MDVLYGMMLVSFSRTSAEGRDSDNILIGQIFYVILSIMSIGKILLLLLDRSEGTFGLGLVPAPELRESAFILKESSWTYEALVQLGRRRRGSIFQANDSKEAKRIWGIRTSQIHRKSLGWLALPGYKEGEAL